MSILVIFAIMVPVATYFVVGSTKASRARNADEYFIYGQQVSVRDYANTSVGYALQMAALFLFAYWAMLYGIGALWTVVFWFVGFWFLKRLLPRFLAFHRRPTTMHGYLSDQFGGGRSLRTWAAIATVLGLWGTMMAEIDYTIQILAPEFPGLVAQFLVGAGFLLFGVWYILRNGYKAEVNTERLQVPIAYAALLAVLVALLPTVWQHAGQTAFTVTAVLLGLSLIAIIAARLRHRGSEKLHLDDYVPLGALLVEIVVCIHVLTSGVTPGVAATSLLQPVGTQLYAQGFVGIVSLLIANALWMPVDFSTWQRIASVKGQDSAEVLSSLDRGTWRVMLESPATWVLGVVLGLEIQGGGFLQVGTDPGNGILALVTSLARQTAAGHWLSLATWIYPLLIVASISIMMSTVHGLISAIAFTADKDLIRSEMKSGLMKPGHADAQDWSDGSKKSRLKMPQVVTGAIMASGVLIYPLLKWMVGANLPTFLYGAYSMQLSLLVVVLLALFKKNLQPRAALVSISAGFALTVLSVWAAVNIPNPNAAVLPPIFAVLGAGAGYVLAYKWRPTSHEAVDA